MDVRPAWQRPDLLLRYTKDYLRNRTRDPWARLGRLKDFGKILGPDAAQVYSRRGMLQFLGESLELKSSRAQVDSLERLRNLGIVHHAGRDQYHFFPDRVWWVSMFEVNVLRASWVGMRRHVDLVQLARHTAHEIAAYQGTTVGLPPLATHSFVSLHEAKRAMQGYFEGLGFDRNPAIRAAFELVQWTHLLYLWDVHKIHQAYEWRRDDLRNLFHEQGWRTSNLAIQQVTSLGALLGVVQEVNHGKLRMGWKVLPWMIPVADGFLNHLVERPSIRTFHHCIESARDYADELARQYGNPVEREKRRDWEAIRVDWLNKTTDLFD